MKEQADTLTVKTMFWCNMLKIIPALTNLTVATLGQYVIVG